ncbi:competence/damage-inducible protein A [Kosmotoga pacifica]|uniref:CinA-like protein n=1 Tax=Kosmotoga pacifica TaxID=1330330 RepID=A0A0G2Z738_9BACT|nr:competence/damage-inducible protein A [Kosmotoga pacifica]AKI97377.1 damage-inducible protein CinA [Kosmotoga pacifica]
MNAEIISVGTELLLGNIVNTNAQYLSKRLAELGHFVYRQTTVGDNAERLAQVLKEALERTTLIVMTGGLGPTQDDLTKETVAKLFNRKLLLDEVSLKRIRERTGEIELSDANKKQAYIPEGAILLPNDVGTAPGCILEDRGKIIVLLPGPPVEMENMFERYAAQHLKHYSEGVLVSRILRIFGLRESQLAGILKDFFERYENPTVAPYASDGEVTVRITARATDKKQAEKMIAPVAEEIIKRLGDHIYAEGKTSLEEVVIEMLKKAHLSIATAESCTGGLMASKLINVPGASEVFKEGIIAYSNEAKMRLLGVTSQILKTHGAVSAETALEMAKGVATLAGSDIGVSITGIAGPGGGTPEKPVGLVYIGIWFAGRKSVKKLQLHGNRNWIRLKSALYALDTLRRVLKTQSK